MKTVNLTDLPELVQAKAIAYRAKVDEFLRGLQGVECPKQPFVKLPVASAARQSGVTVSSVTTWNAKSTRTARSWRSSRARSSVATR